MIECKPPPPPPPHPDFPRLLTISDTSCPTSGLRERGEIATYMAIVPSMIFLTSGFGTTQECVLISVIHWNHIAVETSKIVAVKRVFSCFSQQLEGWQAVKNLQ